MLLVPDEIGELLDLLVVEDDRVYEYNAQRIAVERAEERARVNSTDNNLARAESAAATLKVMDPPHLDMDAGFLAAAGRMFRVGAECVDSGEGEATHVAAEVHSDDYHVEATFNCAHFLAMASSKELQDLAACDWRGNYAADAVAEFMRDHDPDRNVAMVLDYVEATPACGFEVSVDEAAARAWLKQHRPKIELPGE